MCEICDKHFEEMRKKFPLEIKISKATSEDYKMFGIKCPKDSEKKRDDKNKK